MLMPSERAASTIFKVFGMIRPGLSVTPIMSLCLKNYGYRRLLVASFPTVKIAFEIGAILNVTSARNISINRPWQHKKNSIAKKCMFCIGLLMRAASSENVSLGICGQRRPRSACASAQSDQGIHCPLTEIIG